ncbi:MAG TPA: DUF89 family protein [Nitrospirae bacterium]|nr:DUF89 family protein [Nitrospirota bacterium]
MKIDYYCFPCFFKQSIIAGNLAKVDDNIRLKLIKETAKLINDIDITKSPAHFTTFLHRRIREIIGRDPFEDIKREYNAISLNLYEELKSIINNSKNSLNTAYRLAISGNIIDFGIFTHIDIHETIQNTLSGSLTIDRSQELTEALMSNQKVMYLLDNTGEIVFDRVFIELLIEIGKEVTVVVKGSNIINDATMSDAIDTGITNICRVIDNGSDCVGTILEWTSPDFQKEFNEAKLIISKGQGNFETLHDHNDKKKDIFFLFKSKCKPLSKILKATKGGSFIAHSKKDYIYL